MSMWNKYKKKIENLENLRTEDYLVFSSLSKNVKEYIFRNMEFLLIKQERISKKLLKELKLRNIWNGLHTFLYKTLNKQPNDNENCQGWTSMPLLLTTCEKNNSEYATYVHYWLQITPPNI